MASQEAKVNLRNSLLHTPFPETIDTVGSTLLSDGLQLAVSHRNFGD